MSKRITFYTIVAALTLAPLSAKAADGVAVHGVKTVGALTLETQGLATSDVAVHRQGGFALPGSVRWIEAPGNRVITSQAAAF